MWRVRVPARRELVAVAAVFVACALGLSVLQQRTRHHYRLTAAAAITAARANRGDREFLVANRADAVRVIPLDSELQRVTFFHGPQTVLDAAVGPRGEVRGAEEHVAGAPASGAALANSPWTLGLLTALFLAATMVVPLRRLRNLDALVLASLTATVLLLNARLVGASVIWAWLALLYLITRSLSIGLGAPDPDSRAPVGAPRAAPDTPLLGRLCARCQPGQRTRMLRMLVLATTLAFTMITLTSTGYTDVAAASLEGATDLLHGVLPYGHIHLVLHGDTYPPLNYVLYAPGALWWPVSNAFSDLSGSLLITLVASMLAGAALYLIGAGDDLPETPGERRGERGLRAMLAWFAFPPVLLAASQGANDVVLAACLAWMLALRRRRGASMLALAMGVWVKLVPLVLVAIWIPYRRRGRARACVGAGALSVALIGLLFALRGPGAIPAMVDAMAFQLQRGSFYGPWYTFELRWLQPLVQAGVLALVLALILRLRADRSLRNDLVRLSALAAALLLGVQLAANYWSWSYLPWVFPFLAVALFLAPAPRPPARGEDHGPSTLAEGAPRRAASGSAASSTPPPRRSRDRPRSPSGAAAGR
jgi:Glycosyltransferase family 87